MSRIVFARFFAVIVGVLFAAPTVTNADVRLPKVFGANMVLQRDVELPVWGWADAGESVTVTFAGQTATTKAGDNGKWSLKLKAVKASAKPATMTVTGNSKIELGNILVGEVWVCSGQSNMAMSVARTKNAKEEIAAAKYPKIRLFHVPRKVSTTPVDDVQASWKICSPETIPNFTAVGYFFGRHLRQELDVPVGLINTAWGGTRIEPWTPPVGFHSVAKLQKLAKQVDAKSKAPDYKPTPRIPTNLYNGMVHGMVPFAIRGAIWYQGESNRGEGMLYYEKMKALIGGWRTVWKQGDFPFLFVQLAPYTYGGSTTALPEIWEAQTATLAYPNTGMAVITDIGNLKNIHPTNKQDVGKRLALWALAKTYGDDELIYSGPLYKSMSIEKGKIRIRFQHAAEGLKSSDGKPLSWFTIAGKDGEFIKAKAVAEGDSIVVLSDQVANPVAVRFGWDQLAEPNLVNSVGLPASPFRTGR